MKKTTPWIAGSLLTAISVFAQGNSRSAQSQQPMMQGEPMTGTQAQAGYNAPARIDVRGGWDFYGVAAFTYWQASQDNMGLGILNDSRQGNSAHYDSYLDAEFGFKPGFQIGGGMNLGHDEWTSDALYTWFRGKNSDSAATPLATAGTFNINPHWGYGVHNLNPASLNTGEETWKLHTDFLDWTFSRPFYRGKAVTVQPSFGLRAAWIRQQHTALYQSSTLQLQDTQYTNSWGLGPRAMITSNWLIGKGFRFFGTGAADILYTRYTTVKERSTRRTIATNALNGQVFYSMPAQGFVKPHLEMELGLGWGSYFSNQNWHFDLSLGYNFQVFFDQNMFQRRSVDAGDGSQFYVDNPRGNLYMQGFNISARFDF